MTLRIAGAIYLTALLTAAGAAAQGPTLEEVEKDIRDKYAKVQSFKAVVTTISATHIPNGGNEVKGQGNLAVVKDGERLNYVLTIKATIVANPKGDAKIIESYTEIMSNGQEVYQFVEQMGNQRVTITRYLPNEIPHVKQMLDQAHLTHDFKLIGEQTTDGQEVYVIEATARSPGTKPGRIVMHFAKEHGLLIKLDTFSDNPQSTSTVIYSNIETNVDIPPEKFKFIMPAGASVIDRTNE